MGTKRKPVTAEQLLANLHQDSRWMQQQKAREKEEIARRAESAVEQRDLLRDLAREGYSLDTVWDLVNSSAPYPKAVPILLKHVSRPYSVGVKEGIARALTTELAAGEQSCNILINEYKKLNDDGLNSLKWVIGNAISIVAVRECAPEIIELLRNKANGRARDMMTLRFPRICSAPLGRQILTGLSNDPEIGAFANSSAGDPPKGKVTTNAYDLHD